MLARLNPFPVMNTDAPILPPITSSAGAFLAVVLQDGTERRISLSELLGILSGDVTASVADTGTISTRLSIAVGTTPSISLPAVAGVVRNVTVLNSASGNATLTTPGSEKIFTGTADADTLVIATGKTATLWSDGVRWYHVTNDA